MKTVNNVSGGRTSAYIAANYPSDYNLFALVRTNDKKCMYPDKKIRQIVSDKINTDFIGTLEDDKIIHTMLDMEQFIGSKIDWVTSKYTFDEIIEHKKTMPNVSQRFCTSMLKIEPMQYWWFKNFKEAIETRIGFRANEEKRAKKTLSNLNENGYVTAKLIVGKHKNGNNKWKDFNWQKPTFPLIQDKIFRDDVEEFWKNKPVRFSPINNCVGCFHQNLILLRKRFDWHPNKMQWFSDQEKKSQNYRPKIGGKRSQYTKWKSNYLYEDIKNHKLQLNLFESDFNECDSGHCGL